MTVVMNLFLLISGLAVRTEGFGVWQRLDQHPACLNKNATLQNQELSVRWASVSVSLRHLSPVLVVVAVTVTQLTVYPLMMRMCVIQMYTKKMSKTLERCCENFNK